MTSRRAMTVAILFHAAVEATLQAGRQSLRPSHDIPSVVPRDSLEILSRSSRTVAPPERAFRPGSKTRPTESSPHDNATNTPVGYLPTWTTRPGFIDCNATRASGACDYKSFRAIDLVRKITNAILRPDRFCSYRKPRSTS